MLPQPPRKHTSAGARQRLHQGEGSEAFQDLAENHQDELRAGWREDVQRWEQREDARKKALVRASIEGFVIFLADHLLLDIPSVAGVFLCLPLGLGTGFVWGWLRAGRYQTLLLALPAWIISKVANGMPGGFTVVFGGLVFMVVCAADGLLREMRNEG